MNIPPDCQASSAKNRLKFFMNIIPTLPIYKFKIPVNILVGIHVGMPMFENENRRPSVS